MTVNELKDHVTRAFDDGADRELTFVPMFGGACAYVNGRVFAWIFKFALALKADAETAKGWEPDGAKQLQFEEDGPIFKTHIVVPEAVVLNEDKFAEWVEQSVRYVLSQPAPKPRKPRKKTLY